MLSVFKIYDILGTLFLEDPNTAQGEKKVYWVLSKLSKIWIDLLQSMAFLLVMMSL